MNAPSIAVTERRAPDVLARARVLVRALVIAPRPEDPSQPLDDRTVELANSEGLGAWLGARISQGRITVSPEWRERLVWEHQMCVAANVVRARVGGAFAERCQRAGIPLAWLKGMALVQGFVDMGERSMIDIDVLVPASRWDEACRLAASTEGAQEFRVSGRAYTATHDYVRGFIGASGVMLEVHRFVCESSLFGIDYEGRDGLFARATATGSGVSLDEGDLFLTLVAHAAKHTFELPLRSFLDGVVLLQRGRLNLPALHERAKQWRMEKALRLWLQALHTLAPSLAAAGDSFRSPVAGYLWSVTHDASAWQRFLRFGWIADQPTDWARHVLTRVEFRVRDAVLSRRRAGAPDS